MLELFHSSEFLLIFEISGVLSLKICLEGGNLVNLIMHAP
jgi:hypothetical protein